MEMKPNYMGQETKTVWFVLGSLLILLLFLAAAAVRQDYFRQTTALYFFTPNAQGLSEGMAVEFVGFKVGNVEQISMEPNATVKVKLSLQSKYIPLIGKDAKAKLTKVGLVGESIITIEPGSQQVRNVSPNDVLAFERGQDVGELAEKLAGQIEPILSDIRQVTSAISDTGGDIRQSIKNVNVATRELAEASQQLNAMTRGGDQRVATLYGKLDHALDQANAGLEKAGHSLKVLDDAMPGLVLKTDTSLKNIQQATAQVSPLVRNGNALVEDSRAILDGAKRSWPIRNLLPPAEEQTLPLDGYVAPERKQP